MFTSPHGLRLSRPIEIIIAVCCLLFVAAIVFPVFAQSRDRSGRQESCNSHVKQQIMALQMYAEDCDNRLPRAAEWMDATLPYSRNTTLYQCPNLPDELTNHQDRWHPTVFGYAFNSLLSTQPTTEIRKPEKALLTYDSSDLRWNASAPGRTGIARPPRHGTTMNICGFADGHVKAIKLLPDTSKAGE